MYSPTKKIHSSDIKNVIKENSKNLRVPNPFEYSENISNANSLPSFFSHWSKHLKFEESVSKMDILSQTLSKNEETFSWIIKNLMIFSPSKILWQTSYLKSFFLSIMQSVYSSTSTISSLSNYSTRHDRQSKDPTNEFNNSNQGMNQNVTPKYTKTSKKNKTLNVVGGNLVQVFEKDSSTYNKKEINGVAFVWGQNIEGQLGVIIDGEENQNNWNPNFDKKMKIMNPRLLLPLKNTIIKSVSCGYTHSIAITINQNILSWGSNKSCQLGLGTNTPTNVTIPTQIPKLENIIQVFITEK